MKTAVFKDSGTLSCRGEVASNYAAGDEVTIMNEFNEDIYEVMIMHGESRGMIAYINKEMLELND
jgi:hypothetical protein